MLDVSDLVTAYGKIEALKGVTLHAESGRITCLLGPNGAGKTTLMMSIAGILRPVRGSVRFDGAELTGLTPARIVSRGVALVPENRLVFPQMSVATAMAISAAAASPNMGRATSPPLVLLMTMLNIRLGYWIPHPGRLEERGGYTFTDVFAEELAEIDRQWERVYAPGERYRGDTTLPTVDHGLVGIGFSGGGSRQDDGGTPGQEPRPA